jgi:predicted signal transduction protein with EAL and GGDEF domain
MNLPSFAPSSKAPPSFVSSSSSSSSSVSITVQGPHPHVVTATTPTPTTTTTTTTTTATSSEQPVSIGHRGEPIRARVLIVDDDDDARESAAATLRDAGFEVEEASNGLDALKAFVANRPHIALLEMMIPFLDGYSTCRAMRDLPGGDEAAIVMMTNHDDVESLRFGYDAGATDFITKPLNPMLLQHRMRYMLRATELMEELRTSKRKIAHIADHDALTGLPNRRALEKYMQRLTESTRLDQTNGAVFLLDLDGFKRVNDTFGHTAGDELICAVGRRMVAALNIHTGARRKIINGTVGAGGRKGGATLDRILARLGGDEFVFVDPNVANQAEATALAKTILQAASDGFDVRGHQVAVSASVGIALLSEVGPDIERLIQCADAAMYDAKAHDRNNARFYSATLSEKARAQLDLENALRHPNILSQLELFYQPKVDVLRGGGGGAGAPKVVGVEGLLRWRHPERGLVPPNDFIPIAEETGLIVGIGRWVVEQACAQLRAWQHVPHLRSLRIAINVSARQLRDPHFVDDVRTLIKQYEIDPRALEIEITEGTLMNDTKSAKALLNELKSLGIWLALDDFGTGYSALGYLRQFPFDTLKVDRSFVSDLLSDEGCAAITSAIVAMANRLRLNVVAEGVENEGQLDYLRKLGCSQVQGYFFSKPLPIKDFERWTLSRVTTTETLRPPRQLTRSVSAIPPLYIATTR